MGDGCGGIDGSSELKRFGVTADRFNFSFVYVAWFYRMRGKLKPALTEVRSQSVLR